MLEKNPWLTKKIEEQESPEILTKPLPQILDEMEANIRAAAVAAKKAEESAMAARGAAGAANTASTEAAKRAEEAHLAGESAAAKATQSASDAASKAEATAKAAKNVAEKAANRANEILENESRIYNATIHELNNPKYSVIIPIQIVIVESEDEIVARIPELNLYATGDTDTEAILGLKQEIIELYEELNSTDNKLGPLPQSWLNTLNKLIVITDG